MSITITCPAFEPGKPIPARYTCDSSNISPPLVWRGIPQNAKSLVLICDDPDAPVGTWVHWVCYDMPASVAGLVENIAKADTLPQGGRQGLTDFRTVGYGGPCPPSGTHRYFFRLYALDTMLGLPAGKTRKQIDAAMKGHVVGSGELMGTYIRKSQAG
jgi:Raf kinase inhibitor-like YbhB/YbcL family protein